MWSSTGWNNDLLTQRRKRTRSASIAGDALQWPKGSFPNTRVRPIPALQGCCELWPACFRRRLGDKVQNVEDLHLQVKYAPSPITIFMWLSGGEKTTCTRIVLPNNFHLWINSAASLRYPNIFCKVSKAKAQHFFLVLKSTEEVHKRIHAVEDFL